MQAYIVGFLFIWGMSWGWIETENFFELVELSCLTRRIDEYLFKFILVILLVENQLWHGESPQALQDLMA